MPRHPVISTPLVDVADRLHSKIRLFAADGVICPAEAAELKQEIETNHREAYRTHRAVSFLRRATEGDGIDGRWFKRAALGDLADVPRPDDDPSTGGAACAVPSAMDEAA